MFPERRHGICIEEYGVNRSSLRSRRLKGEGKEVLGARETRGAREEGGGREGGKRLPGNHCFPHPAY